MTRVLITGVRGKTGLPLAGLLAHRPDVQALGGTASPGSLAVPGIHPIEFSWDRPDVWSAATEDIDAVYLVRPDRADAPELIADFLKLTPDRTRVVLLSEFGTDTFAPGHWARRVEQQVRGSGHPWTVLRPGWFMQVFTDPRFYRDDLVERGRLPFASGGASVAWIDTRDIAAVAERALLDPAHDQQVYELSGPESMTLAGTAEVLSDVLGRPIEHVELSIAEAVADLPDGFDRDETAWTLERLADGGFSEVTDTVQRVTDRPARALEALLDE